jgi:PleD family two-component response regulator
MKDFLRKIEKDGGRTRQLEIDLRHAGGKTFSAHMEFSPASVEGEPCTQIVIRQQADETELAQQLDYMSQRDAATGLYNRKHFMELLKSAISDATQGRQNRALIQVQLNNIAAIKETVGVGAIDLIIADIARLLSELCEASDFLAYFSENVFTILIRHLQARPG